MRIPVWLLKRLPISRGLVRRIEELWAQANDVSRLDTPLNDALRLLDILPVPPAALRVRVGGSPSVAEFLNVGKVCAGDLDAALREHGSALADCRAILDFGCGCGRTLRWLATWRDAGTALHGCDIDAESIAWDREHLGHGMHFQTIAPTPPTPYGDGSFDLIYAISVFSHLPEAMQDAWLQELQRLLRPGGFLLASVHGPEFAIDVKGQDPVMLHERGFVYVAGHQVPGLPDFYQTAYHMPDYVRRQWGRFFDVLEVRTRGMNRHQDLVVCRRRA